MQVTCVDTCGGQQRALDPLELELQAVRNHLTWVWGNCSFSLMIVAKKEDSMCGKLHFLAAVQGEVVAAMTHQSSFAEHPGCSQLITSLPY